jgi:hypothetical protein
MQQLSMKRRKALSYPITVYFIGHSGFVPNTEPIMPDIRGIGDGY